MHLSRPRTAALLVAVLAGLGAASAAFAEISEYVRSRAAMFGYTVQPLDSGARSAILGQWYLEGVKEKDCVGGFFYEFRDDGSALDQSGARHKYEVGEEKIEIPGASIAVFQMSGGFYLPSYECGLARLVRGPAIEIEARGDAPKRAPKKDRYTARRAY